MINYLEWMQKNKAGDMGCGGASIETLDVEELYGRLYEDRGVGSLEQYVADGGGEDSYEHHRHLVGRALDLAYAEDGVEALRARLRYAPFYHLEVSRSAEVEGQALTFDVHYPLDEDEVWWLHILGSPALVQEVELQHARCSLLQLALPEANEGYMSIAFQPRPTFQNGGFIKALCHGREAQLSWGVLRPDGLFEMSDLGEGRALARLGF